VVYYGLRFYNTKLSRWISRDPLGEIGFGKISTKKVVIRIIGTKESFAASDGVMNEYESYLFVGNDSISNIDPIGLDLFPHQCWNGEKWNTDAFGKVLPEDGCSAEDVEVVLPGNKDDPTGFCSFKGACDAHDRCYSKCSGTVEMYSGRGDCDKDFKQSMMSACQSCFTGSSVEQKALKFSCEKFAEKYYQFVRLLGGGPFTKRQDANCRCSCGVRPLP
jgi:hypothetical protein